MVSAGGWEAGVYFCPLLWCSQSTDLGSAASPGSLLEGQMLGPHLRLTEQETRAEGAMGSNSRHGVSPPGDSDAQPSTISPASVGVGEPEALMLPAETPRYCPFCLGPSVKRGEPPGVLPCGIRVVHPPFVCHWPRQEQASLYQASGQHPSQLMSGRWCPQCRHTSCRS